MSNLGWYQITTSTAKKVGGPLNLGGLILGAGALLGAGLVAGCGAIKKNINKALSEKKKVAMAAAIHTVLKAGDSNEGLSFKIGDKFKILDVAGDAALIEKIGDNHNPYFVSIKFLSSISDCGVITGG